MTTVLSKVARSPFTDAPGFNRPVAEAVYTAIMKCESDEEAAVLSTILLGEMLKNEMLVSGSAISKAVAAHARGQAVEIGKGLLAKAVDAARSGYDPTPFTRGLETLDEVSKIAAYDPTMWSPQQRAASAKQQQRDLLTGRFVAEHKDVIHLPSEKPLDEKDAALIGIEKPPVKLTARQQVQYQRAYREVADMLAPYHRLNPSEGVVHLKYESGRDDIISMPSFVAGKPKIPVKGPKQEEGLDPKRKLVAAQLSVLPSSDLNGARVQAHLGGALGERGALNTSTWDVSNAGSLGDELTRSLNDQEQYTPGARALRRVGALASTIDTTLGEHAPAKVRLALKSGQLAGQLGPEAQKVIGPAADRAAYRYRGIQRKTIDDRLRNAISSVRGLGKREALIHGTEDDQGNWRPSAVLSYFRARLPRADLNTLQRKSGTIPPSEGVIVDKNGQPVVQAVGYGDDHYLPFNLRNLAKLRGGEYIRTRSFGGPTTEDIYTGLVSGANSVTVVSHNGVYTMEFDDQAKPSPAAQAAGAGIGVAGAVGTGARRRAVQGGKMAAEMRAAGMNRVAVRGALRAARKGPKGLIAAGVLGASVGLEAGREGSKRYDAQGWRFDDKAGRMVARYGQLLDAVKSEQVRTGSIDPSRLDEIRADVEREGYDPDRDPERYEAEVGRREVAEKRNPRFSARQRQQATAEFFNELAATRHTPDGHVMTGRDLAQEHIQGAALRALSGAGLSREQITPSAVRDTQERIRAQLEHADPEQAGRNLADALGVRRQLDAYTARKETDYKQGLTPLQLNSQGYELALTALQEQFPYYIKRIDFHPWTDSAGSPFDTGYVAPRHNRPAAALAGYFNTDVLGHGKVRADSVRNQNFAVRRGELRMVQPAKERAGQSTGSPSESARPVREDPQAAAYAKREAGAGLLAAFGRVTHFAPDAIGTTGAQVGGRAITDRGSMATEHPNLDKVLSPEGRRDVEEQLASEPDRAYATLRAAVAENAKAKNGRYVDIPSDTVRRFENGGRYEPPKNLGSDASSRLDDPEGTEYDIPNRVFDRDTRSSAKQVLDTYETDPVVQNLVKSGALPDSLTDGHAFDEAHGKLRRRLVGQRGELMNWKMRYAAGRTQGEPAPVQEHQLDRQAQGLLHAGQLRRRYQEAVDRQAQIGAPEHGQTDTTQVVVLHSGDLQSGLNNLLGQ